MTQEEKGKWLNALVGDELIAHLQYTIAAHVVVGTDYDSSKAEFEQHAADELEHMNTLLEKMVQEHIPVDQGLISLIKNSYSGYEKMKGQSSKDLLLFHHQAEINAIKSYKAFLKALGDEDYGLKQKLRQILNDELEHRTDLEKVLSSVQDTKTLIPTEESALFSQDQSRKFSSLDRLLSFADVRSQIGDFNAKHHQRLPKINQPSAMDLAVLDNIENSVANRASAKSKSNALKNNLHWYLDTIGRYNRQQRTNDKLAKLANQYNFFDPYAIRSQIRWNPAGVYGNEYNRDNAISDLLINALT